MFSLFPGFLRHVHPGEREGKKIDRDLGWPADATAADRFERTEVRGIFRMRRLRPPLARHLSGHPERISATVDLQTVALKFPASDPAGIALGDRGLTRLEEIGWPNWQRPEKLPEIAGISDSVSDLTSGNPGKRLPALSGRTAFRGERCSCCRLFPYRR